MDNQFIKITEYNLTESVFADTVLCTRSCKLLYNNLPVKINPSTQPPSNKIPPPKKQDSRITEEIISSEVISADALNDQIRLFGSSINRQKYLTVWISDCWM